MKFGTLKRQINQPRQGLNKKDTCTQHLYQIVIRAYQHSTALRLLRGGCIARISFGAIRSRIENKEYCEYHKCLASDSPFDIAQTPPFDIAQTPPLKGAGGMNV